MQESVTEASDGSRCRGTNRRGERCQRRAGENGLCIVHGGKLDMKAIGAKGGRSKETRLRKQVRVDDELREQARGVLARALNGEQVDKEALAAARSLFSYRSDVPAARERDHPKGAPKIIALVDLVKVAVETGMIVAERGGPILVAGEVVERVDRRLSRSQTPADPPAVRPAATPSDLSALVGDEAPQFDESTAAKLTRRYGNGGVEWHW